MDASQLKVEKLFDMQIWRMDAMQERPEHEMRKTEQNMANLHNMMTNADNATKKGAARLEEGLAVMDKRLRSLEIGETAPANKNPFGNNKENEQQRNGASRRT